MRPRILAATLALAATAAAPQRLSAQSDLSTLAQQVAAAWARHDFGAVVGGARVELRIPGVAAAGPIPGDQATALLSSYVRDAEEIDVAVTSSDVVSAGSGYAQLRRRYRRGGAGEPQEDSILLGFSRSGEGKAWVLTVVQVSGGGR